MLSAAETCILWFWPWEAWWADIGWALALQQVAPNEQTSFTDWDIASALYIAGLIEETNFVAPPNI